MGCDWFWLYAAAIVGEGSLDAGTGGEGGMCEGISLGGGEGEKGTGCRRNRVNSQGRCAGDFLVEMQARERGQLGSENALAVWR
jgi:hypothetical protein